MERLKAIAAAESRPLTHLALRWILKQPGITAVVFGGRNAAQAAANATALAGDIPDDVFTRMTAISDDIVRHMPRENNLFGREM